MKDKEIEKEVLQFINDTTYNYAILIDGEWGCGKTYFIKNQLTEAIENQYGEKGKVRYVSLYGCKTIEDIQSKILWGFADDKKRELSHKEQKDVAQTDRTRPKDKGAGDKILSSTSKLVGSFLKNFLPDTSYANVAWDWVDIRAYVFVFDDLERCDCNLNELFGFLNELVEHEGAKVVLVANENEITTELLPRNLEQQYMISLSDKITWPEYKEKQSGFFQPNYDRTKTQISFDELDNRRRALFSTVEANEDYKRMREKLIGITIKYDPNVKEIVSALVESSCVSTKYKNVILRNLEYFTLIMNRYNHHNLRTVQFFLSRVQSALIQLSKMKIDSDYREKLENYITQECFRCSVEFKSDYHKKGNSTILMDAESDEPQLNTIRYFITSGELESESFKDDIKQIESVYKAKIDYDDPYSKLYNSYYCMTQKECEDNLDAMIRRLAQDKYPFQIYDRILILAARLQKIGFDDEFAKQITTLMIKNIKDRDISGELRVDRFFFENDDEAYAIVSQLVQQINEAISNNAKTKRKKNLSEIIEESNWVERLENYTTRQKEKGINDRAIFAQVKAQKWVGAILRSTSKEIHDFRKWMWRVYPQNIRVASFEKDWKTLLEIHDAINPKEEKDLIKSYALDCVVWQIEETYKINTGKLYKKS